MARGKGKVSETGKTASGGFGEFANIRLSEEHESLVTDLLERGDDVYQGLTRLIDMNYRVSFAYSEPSQAVVCSLTCRDEGVPNSGLTMTSFAESWYDALCVALVKHYEVAKGDWRSVSQANTKRRFG